MPRISEIPAPRVPFLDSRTGLIAREWYLFLLELRTTGDTYLPIAVGVTNITDVMAQTAQWFRVRNLVTVSGLLSVNPAASGADTEVAIPLPIPSNLTVISNLAGTGAALDTTNEAWGAYADTVNKRAILSAFVTNGADHLVSYSFTYEIL